MRDTGLATLEGAIAAIDSGSERGDLFVKAPELDAVVAALGVHFEELTEAQRTRLAQVDVEFESLELAAARDAKLALYRAVRDKIAAGGGEWFSLKVARERTAAALEKNAHLDADRIWMSLGGPHDGTSRIVQLFRWEDPELFARRAARDAASQARASALKLELERMGVPVPEHPNSLR